jgi:hypothetical protein
VRGDSVAERCAGTLLGQLHAEQVQRIVHADTDAEQITGSVVT